MKYGIFIGLLIQLHTIYMNSYAYELFKNGLKLFKDLARESAIIQYLSDHTILERDLETSVFSGLKKFCRLSRFRVLLEYSLIMRFLLNEKFLRTLVLFHVFSYIFLPTMISVALSLAIMILLLLHNVTSPKTGRKPKVLIVSIGILIALMAFSLVLNQVSSDGLTIWIVYFSTFMFAATVLGTYTDKRFFDDIMFVIAIMISITGVHGIYQKIAGAPIDPAWLDKDSIGLGVRVYSVFGNPNVYGEFLVLVLPLIFAGFNQHKKLRMRLFYGGIFILGGLNVLLTLSRGSIISLAIAILVIVLFKDRKYVPLIIVGVLLSPYFVPQSIIDRVLSIFQGGDTSTSYRITIYTASLDMLRDYFVEGVGLGNFKVLYKAYMNAKSFHAHNTVLMLMIELGVLGFIAWVFYYLTWIREIFSAQKHKNKYSYYSLAAFAGVLGCSIQGIVDHIFHSFDILFIYVVMMTIGVIAAHIAREEGADNAEN